ncbi:MAG: hypothetical protein HUK14_10925 [Muribaculaceae bacterium]|nr:hypothetical protein [Muribaculaceae bacterium]
MKNNEEQKQEFERRRNFTLQECQEYINGHKLNEGQEDEQVLEVDDLEGFMKSLGYSTLDDIKGKYKL